MSAAPGLVAPLVRSPSTAQGASGLFMRPMGAADVEAVAELEARCHFSPWTAGQFADGLRAGYFCPCLLRPDGSLLAYLVGMAGFEEWHLLNVTVAPESRGQGLARLLLAELEAQACRTQAGTLWLEVRPSNARAVQLYERLGYAKVGARRGYYAAEAGGREDAWVMRKDLPMEGAQAETEGGPR
jgi:[ribosomal protein S18]-alanine N-acetyltransferase